MKQHIMSDNEEKKWLKKLEDKKTFTLTPMFEGSKNQNNRGDSYKPW